MDSSSHKLLGLLPEYEERLEKSLSMYIARDPYSYDLHRLIRENYRQVFFNKEILRTHLSFHLEREFRKYLNCGNLAFGMARFLCSLFKRDKLVALYRKRPKVIYGLEFSHLKALYNYQAV